MILYFKVMAASLSWLSWPGLKVYERQFLSRYVDTGCHWPFPKSSILEAEQLDVQNQEWHKTLVLVYQTWASITKILWAVIHDILDCLDCATVLQNYILVLEASLGLETLVHCWSAFFGAETNSQWPYEDNLPCHHLLTFLRYIDWMSLPSFFQMPFDSMHFIKIDLLENADHCKDSMLLPDVASKIPDVTIL